MESFQDCITFHLLDLFPSDAAKQQCYYISNMLKKLQQVPVRYFFQQVEQLNRYLSYLPCTYDSPCVIAATKPVLAYNKAELVSLLVCMCPKSWQDQYDLNQEALPTSVRKLLVVLENIEKIIVNSNAREKAMKENTEKATGKCKKGKCKGSSSNDYHIPKKVRVEKAACCARNMGVRT